MMSPGGEVEVHAQQIRANKIAATLIKRTRVTVREDTISPQVFRHAMCTQLLKPQNLKYVTNIRVANPYHLFQFTSEFQSEFMNNFLVP